MTGRPRVLVLFGGRSGEHEVSCLSARGVLWAIDDDAYDVLPVGITRDGRWSLMPGGVPTTRQGTLPSVPEPMRPVTLAAGGDGAHLLELVDGAPVDHGRVDVCFPVLHGPFGEDGTIQGLLATHGIPFVGSDLGPSSIAIDKQRTKYLLAGVGLPQVSYEVVTRAAWRGDPAAVAARIAEALPFPVFTKPHAQGSSIGVTKVAGVEGLADGIEAALAHGDVVVVEEGIEGVRELEVSVVGNGPEPEVARPSEVVHAGHGFLDFDAKYRGSPQVRCPADIPAAVAAACTAYAREVFTTLGLAGMARVDLFYDPAGDRVLINEVNTIPLLTTDASFPRAWEAEGMRFSDLVGRLLDLALERAARSQQPADQPAAVREAG